MTKPARLAGNGLLNPFTGTKKWTVQCGKCMHGFKAKVPAFEVCSAICPCCGSQNTWSLSQWMRSYEEMIKR